MRDPAATYLPLHATDGLPVGRLKPLRDLEVTNASGNLRVGSTRRRCEVPAVGLRHLRG